MVFEREIDYNVIFLIIFRNGSKFYGQIGPFKGLKCFEWGTEASSFIWVYFKLLNFRRFLNGLIDIPFDIDRVS